MGLTFKANTDDIRESPANYIVPKFINKNCLINVYDHIGLGNFKNYMNQNYKVSNIQYFSDIDGAITNADYVLIINYWNVIKDYKVSK